MDALEVGLDPDPDHQEVCYLVEDLDNLDVQVVVLSACPSFLDRFEPSLAFFTNHRSFAGLQVDLLVVEVDRLWDSSSCFGSSVP